jgi:hypothetical protein
VPPWPEWMDDPAYLAVRAADPYDADLCEDPDDDAPPPDVDDEELAAEADQIIADQERAAAVMAGLGLTAAMAAGTAAAFGRRGPGMPGSAESFPGVVYASRASGFASGKPLDTAPGCLVLGQFAEEAAGDDDRYPGASDDELAGAVAAWERVEAYASSRKHAAVAEVIRRRPAEGCTLQGPAQMPEAFDEFTAREVASVLGETRAIAEDTLSLAHELEVNLPGTKAAFRSGLLNQRKAAIIAAATCLLDPAEARAAEAKVLDRAGALAPPALRAAIQRAVMQVAPGKAKQRREHAAKKTRVERWAEGSGNAGLAGRELPPAEVLAADQRVTAWALELRKAGLGGGMDALRARAPASPSPVPITRDRPADTEPGGLPPGTRTCSSRSARCPPETATIATKPGATIPGSCSGTWPKSGTRPAPALAAAAPRAEPTLSTTSRTRRVAEPVCVMATPSAATTIASSNTPAGTPSSSATATSSGPRRRGGSTPPSRPATPSKTADPRAAA